MGKMILCSGRRTSRPYIFTETDFPAYSIEEVCYFFHHYIYLIDENTINDKFADWMDIELGLTERAERLRELLKCKGDMKTLVAVILCSSDYFTEQEVKSVLKMVDDIIGMTPIQRRCLKANQYITNHRYRHAIHDYEQIIDLDEVKELTPGEYGTILHNLAVAKSHMSGIEEAKDLFYQAYLRNQRTESLEQYFYCMCLAGKSDLAKNIVEESPEHQSLWDGVIRRLDELNKESLLTQSMKEIQELRQQKANGEMNKFYTNMEYILEDWKMKLRQS